MESDQRLIRIGPVSDQNRISVWSEYDQVGQGLWYGLVPSASLHYFGLT